MNNSIQVSIYPWQHALWESFMETWKKERLGHAYLLHGPRGTGKRQFAKALAALLLCQAPLLPGIACQSCRACLLFQASNHPDFHLLEPEPNSQLIKIDQIRALNERLSHSSHQAGRQLALIMPAEAMNIASQNALLKTLEEPPSDSIILLLSAQPALLAPTIRSRCQSYYFPMPDKKHTEDWLIEDKQIDQQTAQVLVQLSAGAPLDALALHDSDFFTYRQAVFQALFKLQKSAWVSSLVEELMSVSAPFETILSILLSINLDRWRLSLGVPEFFLTHQDQVVNISKLKMPANMPVFLDKLLQAIQAQKMTAVNEKLMLESLLLIWNRGEIVHAG